MGKKAGDRWGKGQGKKEWKRVRFERGKKVGRERGGKGRRRNMRRMNRRKNNRN